MARIRDGQAAPPISSLILIFDTTLSMGTEVGFSLNSPSSITIDWGDGDSEIANTTANYIHTYSSEGTYTVKLSGLSLNGFNSTNNTARAAKLTEVVSWGTLGITNLNSACYQCSNLTSVAAIPPGVTDTGGMFYNASSFNQDISSWDMSAVITTVGMFSFASSFNQDIGSWDMSAAEELDEMFFGASVFDQDIGSWDVSSATGMTYMFASATNFNQNLSGWCVSLIGSKPEGFDFGATSWTEPQPVWGTCP